MRPRRREPQQDADRPDRPAPTDAGPQPNPSANEDAQLVRQALAGDRSAFDRLVVRHERQALAVAYRLLNHASDAQEVVQEAMMRAYRALGTLENPRIFGAWLLRIVSNLSLNLRRSRARRPAMSLEEHARHAGGRQDSDRPGDTLEQLLESDQQRPEEELMTAELRGRIRQALDELPDRQRMALVLFSIEQLPQKEVAQIIGCSVEAVKWHVFTARQKLKVKLSDLIG